MLQVHHLLVGPVEVTGDTGYLLIKELKGVA
jgi:hypothetical protein